MALLVFPVGYEISVNNTKKKDREVYLNLYGNLYHFLQHHWYPGRVFPVELSSGFFVYISQLRTVIIHLRRNDVYHSVRIGRCTPSLIILMGSKIGSSQPRGLGIKARNIYWIRQLSH